MRFYQPKRNCVRLFSSSVHIAAPNVEQLLHPTPTGRNTARRAAKKCAADRKTRAQESVKRIIRGLERILKQLRAAIPQIEKDEITRCVDAILKKLH